jgi:hypothetical protein
MLNDLARQMRVESSQLLKLAQDVGLDGIDGQSHISADEEWRLRKAAVEQLEPVNAVEQARRATAAVARHGMPPRPMLGTPRQRSTKRVPPPSDLAKVFLDRDGDFVSSFMNPPPWHVRVERAEKTAREWARCLFNAREAEEWVELHDGISPDVAASLRNAGDCSGHAVVEGIHGLPRSALRSSVAARRPFLRMVEM